MGLEDAFSEADADPGKRKVPEVEGGPAGDLHLPLFDECEGLRRVLGLRHLR
jgi:hypothetical protein